MRNAILTLTALTLISGCWLTPPQPHVRTVCTRPEKDGTCSGWVVPELAEQAKRDVAALKALQDSATPIPHPTINGGFTCVRWDEMGCTFRMSVTVQ